MHRASTIGAFLFIATLSGAAMAQPGQPATEQQQQQQPPTSATQPPADGATLHTRVQGIYSRSEVIKEQLRRMQNRMQLLEGQLAPEGGPARVDVAVADAMTNAFVLVGVHVWIDGKPVYERDDDSGALGSIDSIPAFGGAMTAGEHQVRVVLRLVGNGAVLPYLRSYHFEVADEHTVDVAAGHPLTLTVRAYERGDKTTPFEKRPAVTWETKH
jgi:hypothetical protein